MTTFGRAISAIAAAVAAAVAAAAATAAAAAVAAAAAAAVSFTTRANRPPPLHAVRRRSRMQLSARARAAALLHTAALVLAAQSGVIEWRTTARAARRFARRCASRAATSARDERHFILV